MVDASISQQETSRGVALAKDLLGKRKLFSPLLAPVKPRYWRVEK
jgi:hypothetical protein